jgi:glycosyltransferase involved in cell wall biosynthesis
MHVSLIIPTYNKRHLLQKMFLSVLSQSYQPEELIISDDGSSEDIISGIGGLLEQANFTIKFVRQEDRGFRAARCRNNGVRETKGEFIVCFDQDLGFSKDYLRTLVCAAKKNRFIVGSVVRLSEAQTQKISRDELIQGDFAAVLTPLQKQITLKQYRKELFYNVLYHLKLRRMGPKLRSGTVGFFKDDFIKVNGFDEEYEGWGNEDDDLGIRFYAAGITGLNPFKKDYAVHFFHENAHNGERVNKPYYKKRAKEVNRDNFRCRNGYENSDSREEVIVKTIKS